MVHPHSIKMNYDSVLPLRIPSLQGDGRGGKRQACQLVIYSIALRASVWNSVQSVIRKGERQPRLGLALGEFMFLLFMLLFKVPLPSLFKEIER